MTTTRSEHDGKASDITRVTVLGTGVLGSQIAYQVAYSGFDVMAYDISAEILESAKLRFEELAARYEQEVGGTANKRTPAALARIAYSSDLVEAARDADLIIEAIPERLDLKREVYTKLGKAAPARTIFATNSSTLLPSAIADFTGRPDRFLALHFADPIRITNFVEVMGHAGTDSSVFQTVVDFARRIGMEPIELTKEQPGYILNSLLVPFVRAGLELLVDGVAEPEMIDKVWRLFARAPEGPFQMIDRIGLNTASNVSALGDEKAQAIGRYLKEHYIDRGKLGVTTGEGFYMYPAAIEQNERSVAKLSEEKDFSRVRVNRDGLDAEANNLPYPTHSVVAVLVSKDSALKAVARLKSEGVNEEDVDLFVGERGEAWLHNYHHRSGFFGHLRQVAESLGADREQSREYEEALRQGRVVLVVKAAQEAGVTRIQEALASEGAARMRYYGVLAIRDLG